MALGKRLCFKSPISKRASLIAQSVKNLPAMQETWVQFLGQGDPLEKEMQPTPVFLPGTSMVRGAWRVTVHGLTRVGHNSDQTIILTIGPQK